MHFFRTIVQHILRQHSTAQDCKTDEHVSDLGAKHIITAEAYQYTRQHCIEKNKTTTVQQLSVNCCPVIAYEFMRST